MFHLCIKRVVYLAYKRQRLKTTTHLRPDSTLKSALRPLAITMGDPAGIGPEVVLKCFAQAQSYPNSGIANALRGAFVVGDLAHLERAKEQIGVQGTKLRLLPLSNDGKALEWFDLAQPTAQSISNVMDVPFLQIPVQGLAAVGETSPLAGRIAAKNIEWATTAALKGELSAVVTAPIHKQSLHLAGIKEPGHTEMLQKICAAYVGCSPGQMPVRMMLANSQLRVVLLSVHVPLSQAIEMVSEARILETLKITHDSLSKVLGKPPRIAVAGLNPHAGEGALMGDEEVLVIKPSLEKARALNPMLSVSGPYSPDTVFMRARQGEFDVVLAMYHDQGLIPIKYMGVQEGINVTLGLPIVRTSPDHGTAFEIAGRGIADPSSMMRAVEYARLLCEPI